MKRKQLIISRSAADIALRGGAPTIVIMIGSRIELHPACDLWMQGAKSAEVRGWTVFPGGSAHIKVRPEIAGKPVRGKLRVIMPDHVTGYAS